MRPSEETINPLPPPIGWTLAPAPPEPDELPPEPENGSKLNGPKSNGEVEYPGTLFKSSEMMMLTTAGLDFFTTSTIADCSLTWMFWTPPAEETALGSLMPSLVIKLAPKTDPATPKIKLKSTTRTISRKLICSAGACKLPKILSSLDDSTGVVGVAIIW